MLLMISVSYCVNYCFASLARNVHISNSMKTNKQERIEAIRDRLYILQMLGNRGKWTVIKARKAEELALMCCLEALDTRNDAKLQYLLNQVNLIADEV